MADNTNVNNNAAVTVVGRTAPVPPGQQKAEKSIPVVIASDQSTIPVAEQNKVASEVALSLLGIPRSEVALGIFADVNTYDVNPSEWTAEPEQFATVDTSTGKYAGITQDMGWGLTHVPEESGALLEAPSDEHAVLTSKRFFRYQPGRVSAATFGVKTTIQNVQSTDSNVVDTSDIGSAIKNPCVRKYGIFDNYDGYYWETRNNGQGDNFSVVRRTQSVLFNNPVDFSNTKTPGQTADYGATNPLDLLAPRGNETPDDREGQPNATGGTYPSGFDSTPAGYENVKLGDLCIYRDNLMLTHAGCYDTSLLQEKVEVSITSTLDNVLYSSVGLGVSVHSTNYDIDSGLMTVYTHGTHGFGEGKYLTLGGIGMTCQYSYTNTGDANPKAGGVKTYANRTYGYNVQTVGTTTSFIVNVGVSTVPTFYYSGGHAIGLSTNQYVSYSKKSNDNPLTGLADDNIYKVSAVTYDYPTGITSVMLRTLDTGSGENALTVSDVNAASMATGHVLVTPVPFIQPTANDVLGNSTNMYSTVKPSGMFPYMYESSDGTQEGYVDTSLPVGSTGTIEAQINALNTFYRDWVNQNVKKEYWNVYEYRVPRSRFSGDRLDGSTAELLYSDVSADKRAGSTVIDEATGEEKEDTSLWNLEFDKVTMYKIEFSWYGAVGALFLAYVPVSSGEARWIRVHHLRASNQLKASSLGNATLPITYMIYGGGNSNKFGYADTKRTPTAFGYGSSSEHIIKYGASYYIDGGDRGTVKLFSYGTPTDIEVFGSKRNFETSTNLGSDTGKVNLTNSVSSVADPYIEVGSATGLSTSFYVGAKVITGNVMDQNIEVTYVDIANKKLHINTPISTAGSVVANVDIIVNRPTPVIGLKCRDFIQSSTGKSVRNRTQVYPTRLSTGSTAMIKLDLLKSPKFQTEAKVTSSTPPSLVNNPDATTGTHTNHWNIGKRGKPTKISITQVSYTGAHTTVLAESSLTDMVYVETASGSASQGDTPDVSNVTYNSSNGQLTFTFGSAHNIGAGTIRLKKESIALTCKLDATAASPNGVSIKRYPRTIDPCFDGKGCDGSTFSGTISGDGNYSRPLTIANVTASGFTVNITSSSNTSTASLAEYIRSDDPIKGVYGYFRGYYENDPSKKRISVLGYLENRGLDRTREITDGGFYFSALDATNDNIVLESGSQFLYESHSTPQGAGVDPTTSEFTLDQLSSIKVNPQNRAPIPKTGTIVASLYIPASGEEFDLSSYFDYNKEYLSFPLTDLVESLYLCGSTQSEYSAGTAHASVSASLTWEEQ